MHDASGRVSIVFNGEIYNYASLRRDLEAKGHQFASQSDTEVILEAYKEWGDDCLHKLDGMFAFGLYDSLRARLLIARDRVGEKPLFYTQSGGTFAFASELKALFKNPDLPRRLDLKGVDDFLAFGYVPRGRCIIQGVSKLPPAHAGAFCLNTGTFKSWEYWRLPPQDNSAASTVGELECELEELLESSVRRQMVADVPVGVLLSGGIDSSLVVAMAARVAKGAVNTFNVSFPGHSGYDESPHARLVASHFGTNHTELAAEAASVDLLPLLARQFDEPLGDSSMVPTYLVSKLIRQHATVALGGDGGDELFGGYRHYSWIQTQEKYRRYVPGWIRYPAGVAAQKFLPIGFPGRNYLMGFRKGVPTSIAHINLFFDKETRQRLLVPRLQSRAGLIPEDFKEGLCDPSTTSIQQATRVDFKTYLPDDILVKVDRASMLTSLEMRAPWLDRQIIEFAFSRVPDKLRATQREAKILPRGLAARLLPKTLDLKRKQGFAIPFQKWFRGDWGKFISGVLSEANPQIWNRKALQSLIKGQQRGFGNGQRLFAVTMFELWRREYDITL